VRVKLEQRAGSWVAQPTGPQGSHIQSSLVGADGVAVFGRDDSVLEEGSDVTVEVWKPPQ
jgi:molybdopterin biosynthesis enzyme